MGQSESSLDKEHHKLEEQIHEEERRPYPDQFRINQLKRQKLKIKDEIARTTHA